MNKVKYYNIEKILKTNADYNVIFGERSNGKTFSVQHLALFGYHKNGININGYLDDGSQLALIRRWEEDFKGKNGSKTFDGITCDGNGFNQLERATNGKWNHIEYYSQRWYLARYEEGKKIDQDETPFCYAFALSSDEHYKSTSYPKIRIILFDEFITRKYYLPDEFVKFQSILSTIIRLRDDVKIFMCGNTVNKYGCPYWNEMGLTNVKNMMKGKIDVYTYGESGLTVAVEFSDFPTKDKKSNKYFAFNNPKLQMITNGTWEMNIYPHLPMKYAQNNVLYTYFIKYDEIILQCEIINVNNVIFTYIHLKTTPIKDDETSIIYQQEYDARSNYKRKITKALTPIERKICDFFINGKVFYQNNEIGEIVRNYIVWCRTND